MVRQQNISITSRLHMAEKELELLSARWSELFGSTEAQQSAEDWMEIVTLMSCQTCDSGLALGDDYGSRPAGQSRQFSDPGCVAARETKRPFLATRLLSAKEEQWAPRSLRSREKTSSQFHVWGLMV